MISLSRKSLVNLAVRYDGRIRAFCLFGISAEPLVYKRKPGDKFGFRWDLSGAWHCAAGLEGMKSSISARRLTISSSIVAYKPILTLTADSALTF